MFDTFSIVIKFIGDPVMYVVKVIWRIFLNEKYKKFTGNNVTSEGCYAVRTLLWLFDI